MLIIRKFTKKYSDNQIFFITFALIVVSSAYLLCAHNVKQNNYLHLASSSFVSPRAVLLFIRTPLKQRDKRHTSCELHIIWQPYQLRKKDKAYPLR